MPHLREEAPAFIPDKDRDAFDPSQPLRVRQLGMLSSDRQDKVLYDDKMSERPDFQFEGVHHGSAWKIRLEAYFASKCDMMIEVFPWAERHGERFVTDDNLNAAVYGSGMDGLRSSSNRRSGDSYPNASRDQPSSC